MVPICRIDAIKRANKLNSIAPKSVDVQVNTRMHRCQYQARCKISWCIEQFELPDLTPLCAKQCTATIQLWPLFIVQW
jgi:hypothetical protein